MYSSEDDFDCMVEEIEELYIEAVRDGLSTRLFVGSLLEIMEDYDLVELEG